MYSHYEPIQIWYVAMNAFVHSVMYPYFALRVIHFNNINRNFINNIALYIFQSMQIKLPKIIPMLITSIQLLQMFVGVYVNLYTVFVMYLHGTPADCPHRSGFGVCICLGIYSVFVFLFGKFFIDSYVNKGKVKSKKI